MATGTNDLTTSTYPGNFGFEKTETEAIQSRARFFDGTVTAIGQASNKVFTFPAGTTIIGGWVIVTTDGGASSTLAVGDATTADTFMAAAVTGAAGTVTAFTNTPVTYTAANELQFTIATADMAGAFWLVIEYLPSDKKEV